MQSHDVTFLGKIETTFSNKSRVRWRLQRSTRVDGKRVQGSLNLGAPNVDGRVNLGAPKVDGRVVDLGAKSWQAFLQQ